MFIIRCFLIIFFSTFISLVSNAKVVIDNQELTSGDRGSSSMKSETGYGSVSEKLEITGEYRVRAEGRKDISQLNAANNLNPLSPASISSLANNPLGDFSILMRSRIGFNFKPTDNVRFFIQIQDAREWAEEVPNAPATGQSDDEGLDLHQGYLELDHIYDDKRWSLRVGRTHMNHGDGRLVGSDDWTTSARSGDGLILAYSDANFWIRLAGVVVNRFAAGDGVYMGAFQTSWKNLPNGFLDVYYFLVHDGDGASGHAKAGTGDIANIHVVGTRVKSRVGQVDLGFEGAFQYGKWGQNNLLAYAGHAKAGYNFDTDWSPRIGVEYNYATGDDPNSSNFTSFRTLIPSNHEHYGYLDLATWSNLHNGSVNFKIYPKEWSLELAYHLLMVDQPDSTIDGFGGVTGSAGSGRLAGHEIDFAFDYPLNDYVDIHGGYSHLVPGSFLKDQGITKHVSYGYLQIHTEF